MQPRLSHKSSVLELQHLQLDAHSLPSPQLSPKKASECHLALLGSSPDSPTPSLLEIPRCSSDWLPPPTLKLNLGKSRATQSPTLSLTSLRSSIYFTSLLFTSIDLARRRCSALSSRRNANVLARKAKSLLFSNYLFFISTNTEPPNLWSANSGKGINANR
jgi:hypothetical protein